MYIQKRMNARKESLNGVSLIHIKICIRIKSTFVITLLEKKNQYSGIDLFFDGVYMCAKLCATVVLEFFILMPWRALYAKMYVNWSQLTRPTDSDQCTPKCRHFSISCVKIKVQLLYLTNLLLFIVQDRKQKQNPLKFLLNHNM